MVFLAYPAQDGLPLNEKADVVDSPWERMHVLMSDCLYPHPDDSQGNMGIADTYTATLRKPLLSLLCRLTDTGDGATTVKWQLGKVATGGNWAWMSAICPAQAQLRAPSIIFMDELDGLVPARSGRSGGADQIYASVVSTLLALMDGVTDRGAVVVLAATNRCHHSGFGFLI